MKTARALDELCCRIGQTDGCTRRLPSFFLLRFGGSLFKLPINLLHDISQDRDTRSYEAPNQQGLDGNLEKRLFRLVAELWNRILWQLIMGNWNQTSKFIQKHDLARLACSSHRLPIFDRRYF